MAIKDLNFNVDFIYAKLMTNEDKYYVNGKQIIINTSDKPLKLRHITLNKFESTILCNTIIENVDSIMCINEIKSMDKEQVKSNWQLAYDRFKTDNLKDVDLFSSPMHKIYNSNCYIWYAGAETNCQIHNEHSFKEIHTQIHGLGSMQVFEEQSFDTMYGEVMMPVGFSHKPFFDEDNKYPWHQYYSYSDCLWIVFEF